MRWVIEQDPNREGNPYPWNIYFQNDAKNELRKVNSKQYFPLMKERIIITVYSGSLAKITRELLKDDYEIIRLTGC